MKFSIIYSVDVPQDGDLMEFAPPNLGDLWEETEGDDQYEHSYLEGRWETGHHRKWVAILDREQFDRFIDHCGLFAEGVETMGSLGAPGCGLGWAPAISFSSEDLNAVQYAYVTPLPETSKETWDIRDWQRVRKAVLALYR